MVLKETPNDKKIQLLRYLIREEAADWLEGLAEEKKDTFEHLTTAMKERYVNTTNNFVKAKEIFNRKQRDGENIDAYITNIKKMGRQIGADEKMITYAVMNGMRPDIAAHVIKQQPENLEAIARAARVAETIGDEGVSVQLQDMQRRLEEMSKGIEKITVSTVRPAAPSSPGRARRVAFADVDHPPSPSSTQQAGYESGQRRSWERPPPSDRQPRWNGGQQQQRPFWNGQQQHQSQPLWSGRWSGQQQQLDQQQQQQRCTRCNRFHGAYCSARTKKCHYCNTMGHLAICCRFKPRGNLQ